jgi:hypothetical protein
MDESLLCIDEPAARAARPTHLLDGRTNDRKAGSREPAWAAVGSMALGVFSLVTAEFLPASLLTRSRLISGSAKAQPGRR